MLVVLRVLLFVAGLFTTRFWLRSRPLLQALSTADRWSCAVAARGDRLIVGTKEKLYTFRVDRKKDTTKPEEA